MLGFGAACFAISGEPKIAGMASNIFKTFQNCGFQQIMWENDVDFN
jgi:hypothetical protein